MEVGCYGGGGVIPPFFRDKVSLWSSTRFTVSSLRDDWLVLGSTKEGKSVAVIVKKETEEVFHEVGVGLSDSGATSSDLGEEVVAALQEAVITLFPPWQWDSLNFSGVTCTVTVKRGLCGADALVQVAKLSFHYGGGHKVNQVLRRVQDANLETENRLSKLSICERFFTPKNRWMEKLGICYGNEIVLNDKSVTEPHGHSMNLTQGFDFEYHVRMGCHHNFVRECRNNPSVPVESCLSYCFYDFETHREGGSGVPMYTQYDTDHLSAVSLLLVEPGGSQRRVAIYKRHVKFRGHPKLALQTKGNAVAAAVVEDVDVFFVQTEHDLLKNMLEILVSTPPTLFRNAPYGPNRILSVTTLLTLLFCIL